MDKPVRIYQCENSPDAYLVLYLKQEYQVMGIII